MAELGEEALVEVAPVMGGEDFSAYCAVAPVGVLLGRQRATRRSGRRSRITIRASTSTRPRSATASPSSPARRSTRFASVVAGKGTPAIVAAERAGIAFTVHEYAHDPKAASYGLEAAEKLGIDPAHVFKTLVADVDGTLTVAIVPVAAQLDLKALGKRRRRWPTRSSPSARRATCRRDQPARAAQAAADRARRVRARVRDDPRQRRPARARDRARSGRPPRADGR